MENPVYYLTKQIQNHFLLIKNEGKNDPALNVLQTPALLRIHTDKLSDLGEVSFPAEEIWRNSLGHGRNPNCANIALVSEAFSIFDEERPEYCAEAREKFLQVSASWTFPVERLRIHNERCSLFLQRSTVMALVLHRLLDNDDITSYGQLRKDSMRRIRFCPETSMAHRSACEGVNDELSLHRADLIRNTLRRVLSHSEWTLADDDEPPEEGGGFIRLRVLSVATKGRQYPRDNSALAKHQSKTVTVKCGLVRDPQTGKLPQMETREYLNLRSTDMRLMAMHKYGIRLKQDSQFYALMERLGMAAVTVDMLEVKHSSPVQLIRNGQGSSTKGSSFILYNSARLETLLRAFEERVQSGKYGPLPPLHDVDLTLLKEEEEWQLLFAYIFAFPQLIVRCVEQLESGICGTHLIVRYLSNLVSLFSVYYRRVRILTDMRDHLMPYVYARIYLIKAVREILNKTLALLDIQPVSFM